MKKFTLILAIMLCLQLVGCKQSTADPEDTDSPLSPKSGELFTVIDVAEEISSKVVTRDAIREQMRSLYEAGIRRVYLEVIPEGYPSGENCIDSVFLPADYEESCMNKSVNILLDPNLAYSYECRAAGMEAIAVYAPYDGGGSVSIPTDKSADSLFALSGRQTVGGTTVYNTVFAGEHPEYLVAANSAVSQNVSEKVSIIEVVFAAEDIENGDERYTVASEGALIKPTVYVSSNNMTYTEAEGYSSEYRITYRNFYDANGKELGVKKAYVLTVDLSGVANRQYYALVFKGAEGMYTLPHSMITTYDEYNREITSTVAAYVRDPYAKGLEDYHWGSERTPIFASDSKAVENFTDYGFEFEYGTLGERGDGWADCQVYGIAKGHDTYMRGALCEIYPDVREYWLSQIERLYAMGYDGICIRLEGYGAMVSDYENYGYNTLLVNRFKQECGIDMLSEDFDYLELMSFRGKYFLEFLKEASILSHENGRTVGIELISAFESPELNDDLGGLCHALMPKICFDYKAAVELCDEVVLKDKLDGGYDATVASGIKAYASELGKKCYIFCHSDYGNLQEPYLDAVLRDAACGGAIAEISHGENALDNIRSAMVK